MHVGPAAQIFSPHPPIWHRSCLALEGSAWTLRHSPDGNGEFARIEFSRCSSRQGGNREPLRQRRSGKALPLRVLQLFNLGAYMTNPISLSASTAPQALTLQAHSHGHGHGHRKSANLDTGSAVGSTDTAATTGGSEIGQLPVGVSTALFGNLLQSLGQSIGTQASAASSAPAGGAVNAASVAGVSASASAGSASNQSSNAALQSFLNDASTLSARGNHVNANV
jgi:hypothetical protein